MHTQLTKLIGQRFLFHGKVWIIVEILREEDALVIVPEQATQNQRIQADQYGNAMRRCDHCKTLPLSNKENAEEYSIEVMELLSERIPD